MFYTTDNEFEFKFLTDKEVQNDEKTCWFEVGKIRNVKEDADAFMYVNENIGYLDDFDYNIR